jgi:hypothetical protein
VRSTNNNFIRSLDHSRDPRVCFEMFRDITDELFAAGPAGHSWRALRFARIARYITACQTRTHWRALLESLAACLPSIACSAIGKCCTCAAAFTLDTRHSAHRSQAIARPSCWRQRPNTRNPRRRLWRCDGTLLGPLRTRDEAAIVYRNRSPSSPAREATPPLGAS